MNFTRFEEAAYESDEQIKLLVLFLLFTGCRISDVSGLQVRDINLTENIPTMYLRDNSLRRLDKGGLNSNIPLVGPLLEELRKYIPPTSPEDPFLPQFGSLKSYRCQRRTKIPPLAGVKIHHFARLQVCPQTRLAQCLPQHRSYAGLWSSRIVWEWSGVQGLIALLQPITVTVHLQDMNMMCQPI